MNDQRVDEDSRQVNRYPIGVLDKSGQRHEYHLRRGVCLTALKAFKSPIEFDCMEADCGICVVKVVQGRENLTEPTVAERDFLRAMGADSQERLACQTRILGPVEIQIEY